MHNKKKKLILIIIMIASIVGIAFTLICAKNNMSNYNFNGGEDMMGQNIDGETPPNMPSDDNGNMEDKKDDNGNQEVDELDQNMMPDSMDQNGMPQNGMPQNGMEQNGMGKNEMKRDGSLTVVYIVIIGALALVFSLCFLYLIMGIKNQNFYKSSDKLIIYILSNIILTGCITFGTTMFANNVLLKSFNGFKEESQEKEMVTLDEDNVVDAGDIDLSTQESDVTITKSGTYTFSGKFTHSIIVDANDDEVEIVLNNVEITNDETATIIGLSASKIKITIADGSENTLSDGGNSSYDGCIFSNAELVFDGNGTLIVNGNQNDGEGIATEAKNITFNNGTYNITSNDDGINAGGDGATITINGGTFYIDASGDGIDSNKNAVINGGTIFVMGSDVGGDAGIDTDDGYEINGGLVVALGSDMIETPLDSSSQKTIAFSLSESISKEDVVALMQDDEVIVSFKASKSFKTIIISSDKLDNKDYSLYTGGSNTGTLSYGIYSNGKYTKGDKLTVDNTSTFTISKTINLFGDTKK